ncbi:MAG: PKD domain-containing protein [Ginsengibacter sp.]
MQRITLILFAAALLAFATGCKKDGIDNDLSFLKTATSSNPGNVMNISNDNSGNVTITPTGEGASSFTVKYGDGTGDDAFAVVMPGHNTTHAYPEGTYTVTIISKSITGEETTTTYPLTVKYRAPENILITTSQNIHELTVTATALYAASYLVYFGDVQGETGTPLASGASVKHTYTNAGDYQVKVVALSGGAAQSEATKMVTINNPFGLPITFDDPTVNYFFGTFGDNQQFATVNNPNSSGINTSAKVGQFTRGAQPWSGTYSPLDVPIDMSKGKKIKVWAYNPDPALIGKKLNVELENGSTISNGIAVLKVPFTTSGAWEELVFDFGSIAGIPTSETFKQLVLRFNDSYEGPLAGGQGTVIYIDNFRLTN